MNSSYKKLEMILCLIAGVGLFLPLLTISAYGESASVSFMTGFDMSKISEGGVINSKVVLGVIIAAFIILIVRTLNKDSFGMKMTSFILIIASAVLFYINVDKIATVKGLISSGIKYGIGYYATLIGLIAAFILGLLDLFTNNGGSTDDIDEIERIIANYHNREQISPPVYPNNNPVNNNLVNNQVNQVPPPVINNSVKLSELVNNSTTEVNNNEDNNNVGNQ